MKVACVNAGGAGLLDSDLAIGNSRLSVYHVTVGQEYLVYGVLFWRSTLQYLVLENDGSPHWLPASLFHVTCNKVSQFWRFARLPDEGRYCAVMTFSRFTESWRAFEELSLGEPAALALFAEYRRLADLEFPGTDICDTAIALEGRWLQCHSCSDAWESDSPLALVRCPSCATVMNNPRAPKLEEPW